METKTEDQGRCHPLHYYKKQTNKQTKPYLQLVKYQALLYVLGTGNEQKSSCPHRAYILVHKNGNQLISKWIKI